MSNKSQYLFPIHGDNQNSTSTCSFHQTEQAHLSFQPQRFAMKNKREKGAGHLGISSKSCYNNRITSSIKVGWRIRICKLYNFIGPLPGQKKFSFTLEFHSHTPFVAKFNLVKIYSTQSFQFNSIQFNHSNMYKVSEKTFFNVMLSPLIFYVYSCFRYCIRIADINNSFCQCCKGLCLPLLFSTCEIECV